MSLMHFEPFRAFRELDRLSAQLLSGGRIPQAMPMDVWRDGNTYHVALDLPGVDGDEIDVRVERNTLTVTAQRPSEFAATGAQGASGEGSPEGSVQVLVAERPSGSFTRNLMLGEGLDAEHVQAECRNGVLHLTIPLTQTAQPRRIQVARGAQSGGSPQIVQGEAVTSE